MTERQIKHWPDKEGEQLIEQQLSAGPAEVHREARRVLFPASNDSAMCPAPEFMVDTGWNCTGLVHMRFTKVHVMVCRPPTLFNDGERTVPDTF
jgi:hypothetical protein